jgi:phenylacetate-CoA ligase
MTETLLPLYHKLPYWARSVVASCRGRYLNSWRYGGETESLVEQALEREAWTAPQWKKYQEERLAYVLHRAATRVPHYRDLWAERRRRGDRATWESIENWPVLEKETLRQQAARFVADDCDPRRMLEDHTSGTTGKPLRLWCSRRTVREWYALFEARSRRWYGVRRGDRWAILGGQLVTPAHSRRPPFWVWNRALNQLYMSSYHLAPDLIPYYLEALERHQITYLLGYTSSLNALAQQTLRLGRRGLKMRVAITNAEPALAYQREAISAAFQCPVRETYGMAEIAAAAGECEHGTLHWWPEAGWTERDQDGALISTGLLNADMPLIRYRVGDRIAPPREESHCACGRGLPAAGSIEGRTDDVLYTADGREIGRLDTVFKADLPLVEVQIIQESLDRVRVLYVPAPGFASRSASDLIRRVQERLGGMEVELEEVSAVPRSPNGKFRSVLSRLPEKPAPGLCSKR